MSNRITRFSFPTTIVFGAGAVGELAKCLKEVGISKPLLVTDAGLRELDVFAKVQDVLDNFGTAGPIGMAMFDFIFRTLPVTSLSPNLVISVSNPRRERTTPILASIIDVIFFTVSETKNYAKLGVIINFFISNNKVRFEINETAVQLSGLYMNFRLLNLAKIVNPVNIKNK